MKSNLFLSLIFSTFCATSQAAPSWGTAYRFQFGGAGGQGMSNRTKAEREAIEQGRLKIVDGLRTGFLQTVHFKYTDEDALFICFESAKVGFGAVARNAKTTTELYEELLKLNPESAEQVKSCFE